MQVNVKSECSVNVEGQKNNMISQNTPESNTAMLGYLLNSLILPESYEKEIKRKDFLEKCQSLDFVMNVFFVPLCCFGMLATGCSFFNISSHLEEGMMFLIYCMAGGVMVFLVAALALILYSHLYAKCDFRGKLAKKMVRKLTDFYGVNLSKDALNTPQGLGKVFSVLNLLNNNTSIKGNSKKIINDFIEGIEENGVSSKLCKKALFAASEKFIQVGGQDIQSEYKKRRTAHLAVLWR